MPLDTICSKLLALIKTLPDIGDVYDYFRWAESWSQFFSLFPAGHGWMLTRVGVQDSQDFSTSCYLRTHTFHLIGFRPLNDATASDKTFQSHIDSICDVLRSNPTLDGAVLDTTLPEASISIRVFGAVLCHYTEITFTCKERLF